MHTIIISFFKILFHSLFFWGNFICLPFSGLQTGVSFPNVILSSKAASFLILFCCNSPGFVLSFTCLKSNKLINFSSGFLLAKISNIDFICFVFSFSFSISVLLSSVLSRYLRYLEKKKYITIPTTTICTSIGKPFANTAFRRLERIHRVTSIHIRSCYRRSDMRIFR